MRVLSVMLRSAMRISASPVPFSSARRSFAASSVANSKLTVDDVKVKLANADAVCFDVDSTVIQEEGIDVLADFMGAGEAVAEWTRKAMGGQVLFQDALSARLSLIHPSVTDIQKCLEKYPLKLTNGIDKVVELLHARGTSVYLVSGGFRQMINPVAEKLKIPLHRIYANNLLFKADGSFAGHDDKELTCRDGGKPAVVQKLKDTHGYKTIIMIGDGATDMQARPPADAFIGFGGVITRAPVKEGADWFVTDFNDVIQVLTTYPKKTTK